MAKMPEETKEKIHANLRHGMLEEYGYAMHESTEKRHAALKRAIAAHGATEVFREVNLLSVWHKTNNPELEKVAEEDKAWIGKEYGV